MPRLRDGTQSQDPRLDRLVQFDEQSREYPIRPVLRRGLVRNRRSWTWNFAWRPTPPLDQGHEGACFPAGTLIRMADGSHCLIENLRTLDEVVTAEGRIGRVLQTMVRPAEGLVRVRLRGHPELRCTPEHPFLTQRGYVAAGELTEDDRVAVTRYLSEGGEELDVSEIISTSDLRGVISGVVNTGGVESEVIPLPSLLGKTADLGRLIGLYAAEGHITANKVVWSFGGHEESTLVADTVELVKGCFGGLARVQHRPNGSINVVLYGKTWRRFFETIVPGTSKHGDKRLSGYVTSGPREFLRAIFYGWLDGDGHRRRTSYEGVTVCSALAFDMHAIAVGLGLRPSLSRTKPSMNRHAQTRQERWSVTIPEGGGSNLQPQDDIAVWRRVSSVRAEDWSGWVFNVHVEEDESYVAGGVGVHNCVGFAFTHALRQRPMAVSGIAAKFAREEVYWEAQKIDPWDGGAYPGATPFYEGTSVLAGAKVLKREGYFSAYRWAFGLDELIDTVSWHGPVVLGLNWYEGMYEPDQRGRIHPTGQVWGGHAIVCSSVNLRDRVFRLCNSWGADWKPDRRGGALPGWCLISFDDIERLLHEDGEACVPVR